MTGKKIAGFALASAAAAMFAGAPMIASAGEGAGVKCMGVNACKGNSSCKTANSSCKGQNSCKGTGWVEMSAAACKAIGGESEA